MKYVKATASGKDAAACDKKAISVLFHGHLHTDVPSWSFAFSIDTAKVATDKACDSLSNPQDLISVATCGSVLEFQVRHAKPVVDLPDAHFFNHADTGIAFQAFDDVPHGIWIRRVFVAHEEHGGE